MAKKQPKSRYSPYKPPVRVAPGEHDIGGPLDVGHGGTIELADILGMKGTDRAELIRLLGDLGYAPRFPQGGEPGRRPIANKGGFEPYKPPRHVDPQNAPDLRLTLREGQELGRSLQGGGPFEGADLSQLGPSLYPGNTIQNKGKGTGGKAPRPITLADLLHSGGKLTLADLLRKPTTPDLTAPVFRPLPPTSGLRRLPSVKSVPSARVPRGGLIA